MKHLIFSLAHFLNFFVMRLWIPAVVFYQYTIITTYFRLFGCRRSYIRFIDSWFKEWGTDTNDPVLAPDGSKCGTNKICLNQKCVQLPPRCGDQVVQSGEQCDCGTPQQCKGIKLYKVIFRDRNLLAPKHTIQRCTNKQGKTLSPWFLARRLYIIIDTYCWRFHSYWSH